MPSEVQSAMRPSLSPFEYGAYGTPSTIVSVAVPGPHDSSVGSDDTRSARDTGAILNCGVESNGVSSTGYSINLFCRADFQRHIK